MRLDVLVFLSIGGASALSPQETPGGGVREVKRRGRLIQFRNLLVRNIYSTFICKVTDLFFPEALPRASTHESRFGVRVSES